jgi:hypothetical protein
MRSKLLLGVLSGVLVLVGASGAQAICLDTGTAPVNQCEFPTFIGTDNVANITFAGLQDGQACYGSMSIDGDLLHVGWTKNTGFATVQYRCELSLASLSGDGQAHVFYSDPFSSLLREFTCSLTAACPAGDTAGGTPDGASE